MRIIYQRDGGVAYFPGLSRPLRVDTSEMPAAQSSRLEQLVVDAQVFTCERPAAPPPGAADLITYTLRVEDGRRRATLRLHDPIAAPALQALIDYLEELRASTRG